MYLKPEEIKLYEESIGKVICYPSFTSTSIDKKNIIQKNIIMKMNWFFL